jgi:phage terminase large subunit-like protein
MARSPWTAELERRLRGSLLLEFSETKRWHSKQLKVLRSQVPYNFLMGGNGSGKTFLGSRWLASRMLGREMATGQRFQYETGKTPNFYAVGVKFSHVDRIMIPALRQWIPPSEWKKPIGRDYIGELKNGARVFLKSVEQGADAFQGDEIDACWLDEEPKDLEVWEEIQARTFRRNGLILITMTPWQGTRWLHTFIFQHDQIPEDEKLILKMAIDENPYYRDFPEKLARAHRQWKGMTKQIRFYGEFHLIAGNPVFDPVIREFHDKNYKKTPLVGYLNAEGRFVRTEEDDADPRSWLRIVEAPRPDGNYVIGVDTGGGNPTGDYHAAVVLDRDTGKQVALGHTRAVEPRHFGTLVDQLGRLYKDAFMVVEANNHGISVIDRLRELSYGNLYLRTLRDRAGHHVGKQIGFWTDGKSKPDAVDLMVDLVGSNRVKVQDPAILREMFHFYWLKEDRQGKYGCGNENPDDHDDTMDALFCACVGLRTMGFCVPPVNPVDEQSTVPKTIEEMFHEQSIGREMEEEELEAFAADTFDDEAAEEDPFVDFGGMV